MPKSPTQTICQWCQFIVLAIIFPFLTGCATTTVHPVTDGYLAMAARDMAAASENLGAGNMKALSHDQLIAKGKKYLNDGNISLAKIHFGMALRKNPESIIALTNLGIALYHEGKLDTALKPLQAALDIDAHYVPALLATGKIMLEKGNFQEALKYLDAASTFAPTNPAVLTELAIAYDSIGKEEKAQTLYERVIELQPDRSAPYNNLGFNLLLQKKRQEAISMLAKALQLDKNNIQARNNMAAAYALKGEEKRAYALLQGTVGEAGAYNNLGYIYMTSGQLDKAEKLFHKALDVSPRLYLRSRENLEQLKRIRSGTYN